MHWAKGLKIGYTEKEWLFLKTPSHPQKFIENRVKNGSRVAKNQTFVDKNRTFRARKQTFMARKQTFMAKTQTFVCQKSTFRHTKLGRFYTSYTHNFS
jgi:hypothetical protein